MRSLSQAVQESLDWASNGFTSASFNCRYGYGMSLIAVNTVASSGAKTFVDGNVDVEEDTITKAAHGFATGRKVALTGAVIPTGLSATDYWVIRVDADTLQLAASAADSLNGVAVDITDASGGGTHTLTPAALGSGTLTWQWSPNDTDWYAFDASPSKAVSATGTLTWQFSCVGINYIRAVGAAATGQVNSVITAHIVRFRQP